MRDKRIENLHVFSEDPLVTPAHLKRKYPLSEVAAATVLHGQKVIKEILHRKDHRLFVVVGPCSIHDVVAARDYAGRLKKLAGQVSDSLFLVMRVYFEKPRTRVGWQGLINDPYLNKSSKIEEGLHLARKLLLDLSELGLPVAGEALDSITPQYLQDFFSWTAIGARTTESQTHRKLASAFSTAVGFKNGTDGNVNVAINAMYSAANPHSFLSIDPEGRAAVIRTKGNKNTHIVLRGGYRQSNFDAANIASCEKILQEANMPRNIMVDCSHANSRGNPDNQIAVLQNVSMQIQKGNHSIVGVMLESNLNWGRQDIPDNFAPLKYGVSITDACIDWQTTEKAILDLHAQLQDVLLSRSGLYDEVSAMS